MSKTAAVPPAMNAGKREDGLSISDSFEIKEVSLRVVAVPIKVFLTKVSNLRQ